MGEYPEDQNKGRDSVCAAFYGMGTLGESLNEYFYMLPVFLIYHVDQFAFGVPRA